MNRINKRRIFITGASGFVGANITRALLKNNYEVHILNRNARLSWRLKDIADFVTIYTGDITDFSYLKKALLKAKPDYIIHLAAYGAYHYQDDLSKIIKVNIEGIKNLLEASKNISYKLFINTGSSSEYGYKSKPMKENNFCDPTSYYAVTKLFATHLCKVHSSLYKKPIVTFRLFSVYGPYEEKTRFIPTIIKAIIRKNVIKLTPGNQRRDFVYIDDVSSAYIKALRLRSKISGKIFNIGTGNEYTNDEIVNRLFKITNSKTKIKKGLYPKRTWDTDHWVADISYTKKILRWEAKHSIDKGLKTTYSWFRNLL